MNRATFASLVMALMISAFIVISGCAQNPTGGGGGGGGGGFSADIYVSVTGSDETGDGSLAKPYKTVQKGMNMATSNEVVGVLAGTYTEEVTWNTQEANIKLLGISKTSVAIDGDLTTRCIQIPLGIPTPQTITLENISIRNAVVFEDGAGINLAAPNITLHLKGLIVDNNEASGNSGGGLAASSTDTLIIENCVFSNNKANNAAAILLRGRALISGCDIKYNTATSGDGGGLYLFGSAATTEIIGTTFQYNTSLNEGGGIYNVGSQLTIESSFICFNSSSTNNGGGMMIESSGNITTVNTSTFEGNWAFAGGGICAAGSLYADSCKFLENTSEAGGGGIQVGTTGSGEVVNSLFIRNKALGSVARGGGIKYEQGSGGNWLNIFNNTFVSNEAVNDGPAMYIQTGGGGDVDIVNCIIWGNIGGGDEIGGSADLGIVFHHNDYPLGELEGGFTISDVTTEAPVFVNLANDDLHLQSSSPASIKRGGDDLSSDGVTKDYDGNDRTTTNPWGWGSGYSMGAYEKD